MSPSTMLLEGAIDAVKALRLIRMGIRGDAPMTDALEMIDATIDELDYAISANVDEMGVPVPPMDDERRAA